MAKGTKVKTKVAPLKYVFITGEGRNNAMKGEEPRMQYTASICVPKDGAVHKHFHELVYGEWESYKKQYGVKGKPGLNKNGEPMDGIKIEKMKDPKGTIDPQTEEVKMVPTGNVLITFKTNTKWPDGNPQVVKVFDGKGKNITEAVHAADWAIGEGSTGIIHGSAVGNNTGGSHKVTLYLSAVQIAKLVKYEGSDIDADAIEGAEDIDIGDSVASVDSSDSETPDI